MRAIGLENWKTKNGTAKLLVLDQAVKETVPDEWYGDIRRIAEARWKLKETTAFWKSGKEIGAEAADEGILADSWLEAHFNGVSVTVESLGPKSRELVTNGLNWAKEHSVKTLFTQKTFFNCKLNYAGTADWGGHIDDALAIMDWKRADKVYMNHIIQAWSYALADESEHGDRLYGKIGIGSLGNKDNPIKFFKRNDFPSIEDARDILIACGHLFKAFETWNVKFPYQRKTKEIKDATVR